MDIRLSNYYKRTPALWKRIGDAALFGIPLLTGAFASIPMDENTKLWIIGVCNVVLAVVKIITKFIGVEPVEQPAEEVSDEG